MTTGFFFSFLSGFVKSQFQIMKSPGNLFCLSPANEPGKLRCHLADKLTLFDKGPKSICRQQQIVIPRNPVVPVISKQAVVDDYFHLFDLLEA